MAFKSSRGRDLGKGNIYYKSSSIGSGYAGAGGDAPVPFTASGGTITTTDTHKIHLFESDDDFEVASGSANLFIILVGGGGKSGGVGWW